MIQDYYWHTGDLALVSECAGGIQSVLQFYEDHRKENGFLANLPTGIFTIGPLNGVACRMHMQRIAR